MNIGLLTHFWPTTHPDSSLGKVYFRRAAALAARGHRVTILHVRRRKWAWQRGIDEEKDGVRLLEIPCGVLPVEIGRGRVMAAYMAASLRLLLQCAPQLDIVETYTSGGFGWFYDRFVCRHRFPVLFRVATTSLQTQKLGVGKGFSFSDNLELSLIRSARYLCTHTVAHRDELCSSLGIEPARMAVIPHGVPMPQVSNDVETKPKEKFVLIIGRFEVRKGIDLALAAIPLVMEKHPDCRLVFAGGADDPLGWKETFLRDHPGLADRVRFAGMVSEAELETLYRTCDFYVSPARYESFGLTYIEAMRYSKPVIGCLGSGGAEEVIGDGGLLVPQDNPPALAEAIGRLWSDRELHREFSIRARQRAEHFSVEREAELSEQHYARILADKG